MKYIIDNLGFVRGTGNVVGEPPEGYSYVDELPANAIWFQMPQTKLERIQELFKTMPIEVRAELAGVASAIKSALDTNDEELAIFLVGTIPPGDYTPIREAVLNILNS